MARILLIEDDADIRGLMERFLRRSGFAVEAQPDGEAGVKAFQDGDFDLVLTDGLMPKLSGFDVVAAIRAHPRGKDVGIVMVTAAFRSAQSEREARRAGIDVYLTKPFVLPELKEKLIETMLRYRARRGIGERLPRTSTPAARPLPRTMTPSPVRAPRPAPDAAPRANHDVAAAAPPAPPASRDALRAPPHTPRPPPPLPSAQQVTASVDVARALLTCARHRFDGVVRFSDGSSQLTLAMLRGVVVGAVDNLREHLLGERLWKQGRLTTEQMRQLNLRIAEKGERVAEALLSLGFCSADEALGFVDEQLAARVRRALSWTGALSVEEGASAAQPLALSSLPVLDAILAFGLEESQRADAERFVAEHKSKAITPHPRFEDLLVAVARARPSATLPVAVLGGATSVVDIAKASSPSELYAAWLGGLVALPGDPAPDLRSVPDTLRGTGTVTLVDRDAATEVSATLALGRSTSVYSLLGLSTDAATADVREGLQELEARLGRDALEQKPLGPAAAAARELWALLAALQASFADDASRAAYDARHVARGETLGHEAAHARGAPAAAPPPAPHAGPSAVPPTVPASDPPTKPPTLHDLLQPFAASASPAWSSPGPTPATAALPRPPGLPPPPPVAFLPPPSTPAPPTAGTPPAPAPPRPVAGEDAFLRGQAALLEGALVQALGCFELALATRPRDPDYLAYHAWTLVLSGARDDGLRRLMNALRAHPQAMRPLFFLALAAAAEGDRQRARSLLLECVRRAPEDLEVRLALSSVG